MRRILHLMILCAISTMAQAQHIFENTSLSEALVELDKSSKRYNISFVYDELEDFTVTKTIKRGRSLPDAVREVCGFYPIRISTKGSEIFVECMQKDRMKLKGRLIGPDHQPVAYANITLYNSPSDSVMIGGGVSNESGDFVIPCSATQARVRISCVGFKTIERQMTINNIGTIRMQMENNYLSSVSVSGRMPIIRSEADRLQYIVSNDEFAKGHNALELLSRVPMVSIAGGRAMILGKGPANYMLNGRVSEMGHETIQQKLWTMRAEDIERIEVISIPSGRYQTDMGGGYINIVLQRDHTLGWRGDINTEAGISDDWSERGSGSVSYASKNFDMTIDAHGGRTTQTTDDVTVYHMPEETDIISDVRDIQTNKELATNMTLRYLPTKKLELGGMLSWQTLWPDKCIDGLITSKENKSRSEAELAPNDNTTTKSLTVFCDWHIDSKGKLLSLTYNNYKKDDDARSDVIYTSEISELPELKMWNGYMSNTDYHIQSGRLDLSLPFKIATIDAGISYTSIKNQGILHFTGQAYSAIGNYYQQYNYQEKAKAAYLSLHREWNRYSIKAALRYEHIDFDREVSGNYYPIITYMLAPSINDGTLPRNYWLPSLSFSFKPKDGHQISLSWGTDCVRSNFYDLNTLPVFRTGYETYAGNPELQPSRTSHIELSYHNHHGLYASAYHHHANNVCDRRTQVFALSKEPYAISIPINGSRINKTGLYIRYQHQLTPSLLGIAEGEAYYYDYNTTPTQAYTQNLYGWGKRLSLSADWYLNHQHTLLLNARYQHWFSDFQSANETDGYGYFYFALRYTMLNDRLRISLVANDPFHQHVTDKSLYNVLSEYDLTGKDRTIQFCHTNHHAHYIGLTATYSFGSNKVRQIQRDKKDTESQRALRK